MSACEWNIRLRAVSLFSVVRRAKRETRKWPRARLMARDGAALVSRVSRLCRSRARAFPLLNRKKKRDYSQSNETFDTEVVVVSYDGPLRPNPPSPRSLSVINQSCTWQESHYSPLIRHSFEQRKRVVVLNSFEVLLKELRKRKLTNAKFQQKKVAFRSVPYLILKNFLHI